MIHGPQATVAGVGGNRFEEQPGAVEGVIHLGRDIARRLKGK